MVKPLWLWPSVTRSVVDLAHKEQPLPPPLPSPSPSRLPTTFNVVLMPIENVGIADDDGGSCSSSSSSSSSNRKVCLLLTVGEVKRERKSKTSLKDARKEKRWLVGCSILPPPTTPFVRKTNTLVFQCLIQLVRECPGIPVRSRDERVPDDGKP
ncbi:hypothetical protein M0804_005839 [Polistes exclamans]|nr:hypothetical protein M0804_005839 [Polistes exclamans]